MQESDEGTEAPMADWSTLKDKVIVSVASAVLTAGAIWGLTKAGVFVGEIFAVEVPGGAVVAFENGCPTEAGWVPFTDGHGKFLLGAGQGELRYQGRHHRPAGADNVVTLTPVEAGDQGGAEKHTLTEQQMPSHTHELLSPKNEHRLLDYLALYQGDGMHDWLWARHNPEAIYNINENSWPELSVEGGGEPHNNMPPYVALYFCKKVAG